MSEQKMKRPAGNESDGSSQVQPDAGSREVARQNRELVKEDPSASRLVPWGGRHVQKTPAETYGKR